MSRKAITGPTGAYGHSGLPLPLFDEVDPGAAHHHRADTSVASHDRVKPFKRATYERILTALRARGPAGGTVHELAEALGKLPSDISGRLFELRKLRRLSFLFDELGQVVKRGGARVLIESPTAEVAE